MHNGRFISIEGSEGAGKSSALQCVRTLLQDNGIEFVITREPGGTATGEQIRQILLDNDSRIHPDAELLLMYAARAQHYHELILPAINAGKWVISDRFSDSSFAYQGGGRGIPLARIEQLEQWTLAGFAPDLTILLDIDPAVGLARASGDKEADRFEREQLDFFNKVRAVFLERAKQARFVVIDASKDQVEVQQQITNSLRRLLCN